MTMDKKMEVIVNIALSSAGSSATPTSVNTMAICVIDAAFTEAKYYVDLDDVEADYTNAVEAYTQAVIFFGQTVRPQGIVIIPVTAMTDALVKAGCDAAEGLDFYHVCLYAGDAATDATIAALATSLETYGIANYKMFHIEAPSYTVGDAAMTALVANTLIYVSIWSHDHSEYDDEFLNIAICTRRCGLDPARGMWAHKEVNSTTADTLTKAQLAAASASGLNVYTDIANTKRTFFGTCGDNTTFIDTTIKNDWLRFRTMEAVFNLLGTANDGYGITYDDAGAQSVGAAITSIFNLAKSSDRQYIMEVFTVVVPEYASIPSADVDKRNLPNIKVNYTPMDSIHTVLNINFVAG